MKAINKNKTQIVLPTILLGLLAANTSWQSFLPKNEISLASTQSISEVRADADLLCEDTKNGFGHTIIASLENASKNGSSSFRFLNSKGEDLSAKVKGKSYKYSGNVQIRKVVSNKELHEIDSQYVNNGGSQYFGATTEKLQPEEEEVVKNDAGRTIKSEVPRYDIYEVRVSSETTEGDWCDNCDAESAKADSEVRYVKVKIAPTPDTKKSVCVETLVDAKLLFQETEKELESSVRDQIEEIVQIAKEEELEAEKKRLVDSCQIKKGADLSDVEEYMNEDSIDERYSYKNDPEGKMTCFSKNMSKIKDQNQRDQYFISNMMPAVKQLLTSPNEDERKQGMALLQKMNSNTYGALTPNQRSYVNRAAAGSQIMSEVYRLNGLVERSNGMYKDTYKMQLDSLVMQAEMKFVHEPNAMGPQLPVEAANDFGFWYDSIKNVNGTQFQVTGVDPMGALNLSGRTARLASGDSPFLNQDLISQINAFQATLKAPGYLLQGVDNPAVNRFTNTLPPTAEMSLPPQCRQPNGYEQCLRASTNRLARGRN
ncbi:MAG: hypothetical protein KDD34_03290 [Bdellovibrionales bacterium]|nr:hypothetical protein [Bdellovibrionales bacterium]